VERVARDVARRLNIGLAEVSSPGRSRAASQARALTAWAGREAGNVSIARTAKYFGRDTSTMARNVARLEARMRREKGMRKLGGEILKLLDALRNTIIHD